MKIANKTHFSSNSLKQQEISLSLFFISRLLDYSLRLCFFRVQLSSATQQKCKSFSSFPPFLSYIWWSLMSQQFYGRVFRIFSNNLLFVIAKLSQWIFRITLFAGCKTLRSCDGCPAKLCNFLTEKEACPLSFPFTFQFDPSLFLCSSCVTFQR